MRLDDRPGLLLKLPERGQDITLSQMAAMLHAVADAMKGTKLDKRRHCLCDRRKKRRAATPSSGAASRDDAA